MKKQVFRKSPLAAAVSLVLSSGFAYAADDQINTGSADGMEEVVVTGIRGSLKRSMDLKRDTDGVVEAITAEDIGDFSDSNLAESLQRITGVSIDRQRGEGSRVTVRGFGPDFNLVLLNGRQMPTSSTLEENRLGRSFDFANLSSDNIAAVEVYKSGQANVPTGGIGSTINVKTTRPLEAPGMIATVSANGLRDESTEDGRSVTPEISALFSNTFAEDTIGIALSVSHQERDNGVDTASVNGWRTITDAGGWGGIPEDANQVNRPGAGEIYSVPQAIGYEFNEYEQVRTNGQMTVQWRPQESVIATLDYTYADLELEHRYNNLSAWFNFGGQTTAWTDGPVASATRYSEASTSADYAMGAAQDAIRNTLQSTGLNVMWDVSDNLTLTLDYHDSSSDSEPNSPFGDTALLGMASFTRDVTTGYFEDGSIPVLELGLSAPLAADDMIVTGSVFTNNVAYMDIEQLELSGDYEFDTDFIDSIDFGIQLTDVDYRSAGSVVQRDAWGGVTQPGAISDLLTPASAAGAFDEVSGGNDPRLQTQYFTWDMASVIARTEALMASGDATTFQIPDMGDCGTGLCPSSNYSSDRRTEEQSDAIYVQVNMSTEVADRPVDIRLGVRYEQTDVSSQALSPAYTRIDWVGGNEFTAVRDPVSQFSELDGDYNAVLPNLDIKVDITDELVGRASFSKTLTRPKFDDIQGGQTLDSLVRVNGGTGSRGNPALKPFESVNIDLSLEYYYANDSYVAVGYFHKDVENFIGTSSLVENAFNLPHPAFGSLYEEAATATGSNESGAIYSWILANRPDADGVDAINNIITGIAGRDSVSPFNLTVPVNIEEASVDGWEFVIQHNFGDTGFGVIANATLVDADVGYDNLSLAQQFVLSGLSDSANLIAFYDKNGLGVRLAYNWRDSFLSGTGQRNVGAGPPTYVDEYRQLDLSVTYWYNDNLQFSFGALNLTNETTYVYGRDERQTLFASQLGTRYTLGLRYKL
ncbi:MAG: TonB-dependent receptor [Candidatus Azotimanducaceae bacterium WSBS_2022_MAG_OTU7]